MILSSIGVRLKGMLRTKAASSSDNNPRAKSESYVLVIGLMRSETLPFSKPGTILEKTHGWSCDGSHASFQILIASLHPTLHLAPFSSTSLPFRMLCQACEPELDSWSSHILQFGKKLRFERLYKRGNSYYEVISKLAWPREHHWSWLDPESPYHLPSLGDGVYPTSPNEFFSTHLSDPTKIFISGCRFLSKAPREVWNNL